MFIRYKWPWMGLVILCGVGILLALHPGASLFAAQQKKTFKADKGPAKIDPKVLATYPKSMRDVYAKTFSKRCSKCHPLARPINTDFSPSKWQEYIKKMMRKPGSGVKKGEAKKIWEFLVYDTAKRKKKFFSKMPEKEKKIALQVMAKVQGQK